MRRCVPLWFYPLGIACAMLAYGLGVALKPKAQVTLIFEAYDRNGRPLTRSSVFILNSYDRPVYIPPGGVAMTRPIGHEQELIFSSTPNMSPHSFRVNIRWQSRQDYLRWLENDFLRENNLDAQQWQPTLQRLRRFAGERKQHYPIVVPDRTSDFWKN